MLHSPMRSLANLIDRATITLHNAYIELDDRAKLSTKRCLYSSRAILDAFHSFVNACSSVSTQPPHLTRLHPFVVVRLLLRFLFRSLLTLRKICWYLAAVVQVQLCRSLIELQDFENEQKVWKDINILRLVTCSR